MLGSFASNRKIVLYKLLHRSLFRSGYRLCYEFSECSLGATFRIRFKDRARSRITAMFRAKVRAMVSRPRHEWTNTQIFANFSLQCGADKVGRCNNSFFTH